MRKHGKKGSLTQRFGTAVVRRTARPGVQLSFAAGRSCCRWASEARAAAVIKH